MFFSSLSHEEKCMPPLVPAREKSNKMLLSFITKRSTDTNQVQYVTLNGSGIVYVEPPHVAKPALVSNHLLSVTTFPKYQINMFSRKINYYI